MGLAGPRFAGDVVLGTRRDKTVGTALGTLFVGDVRFRYQEFVHRDLRI